MQNSHSALRVVVKQSKQGRFCVFLAGEQIAAIVPVDNAAPLIERFGDQPVPLEALRTLASQLLAPQSPPAPDSSIEVTLRLTGKGWEVSRG